MLINWLSKGIFTGLVLLALLLIVLPQSVYAQTSSTPIDTDAGNVVTCDISADPSCSPPPTLTLVEFWVIKALYITWAVGGFIFLFGLVAIGFRWMTSGGDQQKLEELKKQATYWAISIPIFFGGVPAVNFVLQVFPVSKEATCTQQLNSLPAFQLVFPGTCLGSTKPGAGEKTPNGATCCSGTADCRGNSCNVTDNACATGLSCSR